MPQHDPVFWSSCCGALVDYAGYYRCRKCGATLHMGRSQEPHLLSVKPPEAASGPGRGQRDE